MLELYQAGSTDDQVADEIGISIVTLNTWKKKYPDFLKSLKETKGVADQLVESSLFQRATGYWHPEEKVFCYMGQIVTHTVMKHYPPDTTAAIFWLKNRQPDLWREKLEISDSNESNRKNIAETTIKTFEEFCFTAGYPRPFAKQIEMKEFGIAVDEPRLILGARGYGKTDYVTILGVGYSIYCDWFDWKQSKKQRDPQATDHETNLIISKSKTRNTAIVGEIAESLKKNGVPLAKENASLIRVEGHISKDHSVEVLTIKSSFRGRHPKRILMDDPVTEEDTSEAMRTLVKKKYDEAYKLCKNIVIIGQPAHAHDLYAELRPQLKKMEVAHGQIPQLDADLEAMKIAGVDPISIEMSYHLRIPAVGDMPFANIKYIDKLPIGETVAFIDPSDGGDYTATSIIKGWMDGVAVQGHVWKLPWYHALDEMVERLKTHNVKRVCFETNHSGTQPLIQLRQILSPMQIGVVGVHSDTNKHATIMSAGSYSHLIHLSRDSDKKYIDQVVKYEKGVKNDDAPDSLARGLQWLGLIKGKK